MAYSIYGAANKSGDPVSYGTVETLEQAAAEMKRLRQTGVPDVYAISFDSEVADLQSLPRPVSQSN